MDQQIKFDLNPSFLVSLKDARVYAYSPGKTVLTYSAQDGSGQKLTVTVNVKVKKATTNIEP